LGPLELGMVVDNHPFHCSCCAGFGLGPQKDSGESLFERLERFRRGSSQRQHLCQDVGLDYHQGQLKIKDLSRPPDRHSISSSLLRIHGSGEEECWHHPVPHTSPYLVPQTGFL
ncbi:hypothetical protein NDU88_007786, partial [Pleurodeles waltl]